MAQSRHEASPSRTELVVLACLSQSKPPSDAELGDAVHELAFPKETSDGARQHALELLSGLVHRAWVTPDDGSSRRGKSRAVVSPRKLTDSGKRVLREAFQLSRAPTWAQVRDKHLPSLALGLPPGSERASKACTESALTAAVLCSRFGIHDASSPAAVCDALVAKLLGMPPGRLTLDRIRAHVLARDINTQDPDAPRPDAKGYAVKLAGWIACNTVGARGPHRSKMARALARRWVSGDASSLGEGIANAPEPQKPLVITPPPTQAPSTASAQLVMPTGASADRPQKHAQPIRSGATTTTTTPAAGDLLAVVRETIPRIGTDGRFGEKVYVSSIWRTIERDRKVGALSLDEFKRWLLRANRDGSLVLARADLIGAMDAKQVAESEINDRGATFHFVLDQRNGASVSQRESHASR